MIIVKLQGGLGNQMFQYAFGRYLANKHNTKLKLDLKTLLDRTPRKDFFVFREYDLDIFKLDVEFADNKDIERLSLRSGNRFINSLLVRRYGLRNFKVTEPSLHFSEKSFSVPDNSYINGYWQSIKYFKPVEDIIRKNDFIFRADMSPNCKELARKIMNSNSVCVNIRRLDFTITNFHGTCSPEYYNRAENIVVSKIDNPHYFVFSDEIEWCSDNIKFDGHVTYVGHEYKGNKFRDYLELMSLCKHFIIPNSSFAWWAAWLSNNPNKIVIAPQKWFTDESIDTSDIIPEEWLRI